MKNITLSIPEELHKKLKDYSEIKWSQVIREVLKKKIKEIERMEKIISKSELDSEEALEISEKIKEGIAKRHGIK